MARPLGAKNKKKSYIDRLKLKKNLKKPVKVNQIVAPPEAPKPEITEPVFVPANESTDFDSGLDAITNKIKEDTELSINQSNPIEDMQIELAQEIGKIQSDTPQLMQAQLVDEWRPPSQREIEKFQGIGGLACKAVDFGSVYWKKTEKAKLEKECREKLKGIIAEIACIYMPEATGMSDKTLHIMCLLTGLTDVGADHIMRIISLEKDSKIANTAS